MLRALYNIIACDCTANITHNRKMNKCCIVMQFIMCVYFGSIKTINLIKTKTNLVAAGPPLDGAAEPGLHPEEQLQGARPAPTLHHHGGRTVTRALFNSSFYYILSASFSFLSPVRFSHYNLISCP